MINMVENKNTKVTLHFVSAGVWNAEIVIKKQNLTYLLGGLNQKARNRLIKDVKRARI